MGCLQVTLQTKLLSGYSYFVDKIKYLCKNGSELKEAIDIAVRECIKEGELEGRLGIIKNYLENGGTVAQARELLKATEEEIQKVTKEL